MKPMRYFVATLDPDRVIYGPIFGTRVRVDIGAGTVEVLP